MMINVEGLLPDVMPALSNCYNIQSCTPTYIVYVTAIIFKVVLWHETSTA